MALPSEYDAKELRITLRPAADCSRFWMNLSAVLQVTGGSIAVVAAYGVEGATFGLATPAAIALGFWGADQTYAGMKTLVNQTPSTTALGEIFELAGVSPDYSEMVAGLLPIGPSAIKGAVSLGLKSSALRSIDVQVVKQGGQIVIDHLSFIATKTRERFTFRRIANKTSKDIADKTIETTFNRTYIEENIATSQQIRESSRFKRFIKSEGKIQETLKLWPPNRGAYGPLENITLPIGSLVDRYGFPKGFFLSPAGASFESRALPAYSISAPYHVYEVIRPIDSATKSKILPWFGQKGQGIQYELKNSVQWYLDNGYLRIK